MKTLTLGDILSEDCVWCCDVCNICLKPLPDVENSHEELVIKAQITNHNKLVLLGYHTRCWLDKITKAININAKTHTV